MRTSQSLSSFAAFVAIRRNEDRFLQLGWLADFRGRAVSTRREELMQSYPASVNQDFMFKSNLTAGDLALDLSQSIGAGLAPPPV